MNETARTLANRYALEAAVGRGGMGIVHRARDLQLDRRVAVKLVSEVADPAAKERFLTEARRTAGVRHPSIVEVFDVGEDEGDAFLVMELLEGQTLGERLAKEGHLEIADAVAIAGEICDALTAAHDAGLVHRDLKPANVFLLATAEAGRRVKLLDFGIAKRIDGTTARTDPNMLVGTLEYMAPEQILGARIDGRADLYALGMTLYRMLTGTPAFDGETAATLVHQHLDVVPVSPRERAPARAIPVWLDALVMRLLAKKPDARLASAREVKEALDAESHVGAAPVAPVTRRADAREGMRMLEDDGADGDASALELDLPPRPPAPPAPPLARIEVAEPAPPAPMQRADLPAWLEPLSGVPIGVSKRVTGYSLFVLVLYLVFFRAGVALTILCAVVAAFGGLCMWAASRASR
ncbi:MAG: putative serine/threonine protein kinase [Labilithrix sp.]|nr:putative serine/threonine protein kinase [Labilithrix sp.]